MHRIRCHLFWPDDTLVVRELLNQHTNQPCDTDTIRTHPYRNGTAGLIFDTEPEISSFLLAKIKNISDLCSIYFLEVFSFYAKTFQRFVVENFFVDCNSFLTIEIDDILA